MTTMTTTDPILVALATPEPTADVAPCGCISTANCFLPCRACRDEVDADLDELYADDREYEADWITREMAVSRRVAAAERAAEQEMADADF